MKDSVLSREEMEVRRMTAVEDIEGGKMSLRDIGRKYGVTGTAIYWWKKTIAIQGPDGLKRRKVAGRPSKLTNEQEKQVLTILGSDRHMTTRELQTWIKERFGYLYNLDHLGRKYRKQLKKKAKKWM